MQDDDLCQGKQWGAWFVIPATQESLASAGVAFARASFVIKNWEHAKGKRRYVLCPRVRCRGLCGNDG